MILYIILSMKTGYRLLEGSLGTARLPSEDNDKDEAVAPGHHIIYTRLRYLTNKFVHEKKKFITVKQHALNVLLLLFFSFSFMAPSGNEKSYIIIKSGNNKI